MVDRAALRPDAGLTLIEILTVLAILAVVLGLSLGVYQRISVTNALPAATSQASTIIRSARNFSVSSGLPSRVFVEPETPEQPARITAFGYELVAGWHFEDAPGGDGMVPEGMMLRGGFNERATVSGEGVYSMRGKIGRALYFSPDGIGSAVVAPHRPRYQAPRGFSLEAWVQFEEPMLTKDMLKRRRSRKGAWIDPRREDRFAVISKRDSYEMGLLGDSGIYVTFGEEGSDEGRVFETDARGVVPGRWAHLRASYDGIELTIEVDGMTREWYPQGFRDILVEDWPAPLFPESIPQSDSHLTVSRQDRIFLGGIDEPKVRVALDPRSYELVGGVSFVEPREPLTIRFDTRGALDPRFHTDPIVLVLTDGKELEEEPTPGQTVVVAEAQGENGEHGTGGDPEDEAVGDPLVALTRYLARNPEARLEGDEENFDLEGAGAEAEETQEQKPKGRTREIIIDLTGAIRG